MVAHPLQEKIVTMVMRGNEFIKRARIVRIQCVKACYCIWGIKVISTNPLEIFASLFITFPLH